MTLGTIDWVFFDLGCTLIDESAAMRDAHGQLVRALSNDGVETSEADIETALAPAWEAFEPSPIVHVLTQLTGSRDGARGALKQISS